VQHEYRRPRYHPRAQTKRDRLADLLVLDYAEKAIVALEA